MTYFNSLVLVSQLASTYVIVSYAFRSSCAANAVSFPTCAERNCVSRMLHSVHHHRSWRLICMNYIAFRTPIPSTQLCSWLTIQGYHKNKVNRTSTCTWPMTRNALVVFLWNQVRSQSTGNHPATTPLSLPSPIFSCILHSRSSMPYLRLFCTNALVVRVW